MCRRLIFLICVVLLPGLAGSARAAVPPGWSNQDIGTVTAPGSANESGGVWTMTASSGDIWGTVDSFHYAYVPLRGDGEIRTRVASLAGGTSTWRKAGVMIRETLNANSKFADMIMRPGTNGGSFQWRATTGGGCGNLDNGDPDIPNWVRLVRQGNWISAWTSTNGTSWTQGATVYIDMAAQVYVGLCLTPNNAAEVTTATFDSVSVPNPGAAYYPSPADTAVKVDINADLAWTAGDGATSHEVYFGTAASAMAKVATNPLGTESYDPGTLAYNTDYYWQIVEVGGAAGPVWTFATVPDPAVISDPDLVGYYKLDGNADDSSGYGNHGSVLGNPTWVSGLPGLGSAISLNALDGIVDSVKIGRGPRDAYNFKGSFSIAVWVNISNLEWWRNWVPSIVGRRGEENRSWTLRRADSPKLSFTTRLQGNDDTRSVADQPLNRWVHITAVYDMAQNKKFIYFDGVKDQEVNTSAGFPVSRSDHDTYIGARSNSANTLPEENFTGLIDEVRLYSRALSAAEVTALAQNEENSYYKATIPVPADKSIAPAGGVSGTGVFMTLDYTAGPTAVAHTAYFSDDIDDVLGRDAEHSLGSPPYPEGSVTAYYVGFDAPEIPVFARAPLERGKTYYWAVDESDGVDTFPGALWTFTIMTLGACGPTPADGAEWVPAAAGVALSWKLGDLDPTPYDLSYDVYYGTVFADVNTGTIPDANVTAATYTTPALLPGTVYYWRVDTRLAEKLPPFNFTLTTGEVWSFTTLPVYGGSILREWWIGVNGGGIANLLNSPRYPSRPHGAALLSLFEGPSTWADNYGSRYQGWLLVQRTGYYKFWSASDDNSRLFLSTDEDPVNAVMISQTTGSTGARTWGNASVIPSAPILLEAGRAYYIYALHKEGGGGDNMAVGWMGPGISSITVIPGSSLVPYMPAAISPSPANGAIDLPLAGTMLSWTAGFDADTFSDYAAQRVYFGTDAAAVANADTTSPEYKGAPTGTNSYGPVSLDYYKQYFWRIDGVTGGGQPVKGNVWSFTGIYDASQIVDPNLVGWWKLDGDADDSSGYANHGVENGSPLYVDAVWDLGIDFDGVNDYINCGNSPRLNMNTNITVACWVKSPLGPSWSPFVTKRGEDGMGWKLRRQGGNNEACFTLRGTSGADDQRGNININDAEWHHVAGTYNGAQRNLYVDGRLDTGGSLAETGAITATPGDDVVIGAFSRAGQSPYIQTYSNATIDDARIYNRALTQAEIAKVIRFNVAWAWKPSPRNKATGVSLETVLTWTPGDYAPAENGHYVNFGADDPANMVLVSGPQTPNNYTPSPLDLDRAYYWAVDEVNAAAPGGVDKGPIWSFTTANNVVVDDMEGYFPRVTDPNIYVYAVWVDGAGDCNLIAGNNTGALVDIATTPVHGGQQAMKLKYDNDGTVDNPCPSGGQVERLTYSKAEALDSNLPSGIGSDWTIGGAKALSLWFYGDPLNSVEPMWVQLTDGSDNKAEVLYGTYVDEDVNDMNEASWHEWFIDLADFTDVNLTNVKSIAIGIGNEIGPAGGAGTLYFDDIRLYTPRCILARREADFALVDYAPTGNPSGNCAVNGLELEVMMRDWLKVDYTAPPLLARYELDGNYDDSSGNGHHGTPVGAGITFVTDPTRGQVLDLPGGDNIYVNCGAVGISGAMPRTIACWAKADNTSIPDWTLIFGFTGMPDGSGINGSHFNIDSIGGPGGVGAHCWGWEETIFTDTEALEWRHYAMTYDGTTIKYYGDGVPMDTDLAKSNVQNLVHADRVHIGKRVTQASSFPGLVDDACVFDRLLTDAEIVTVKDGGAATLPAYYHPIPSPANVVDPEAANSRAVNFKDYSLLANKWLEENEWPLP